MLSFLGSYAPTFIRQDPVHLTPGVFLLEVCIHLIMPLASLCLFTPFWNKDTPQLVICSSDNMCF